MSLLGRKPTRIGRAQREARDDRVFLVATEDTHAPAQYFEGLAFPRLKVFVLPAEDGRSAPGHVLDRLREAFASAQQRKEVQANDEFWLLLDTDHWIKGTNLPGLLDALQQAQKAGFRLAMSNPCFELWLLLHHEDVPAGTSFGKCAEVGARLRAALDGYNKVKLRAEHFPRKSIPAAIQRARGLEATPDSPGGHWPEKAGTRVYLLLESISGKAHTV
jgi:hypothetical protein